MNAPFWLSALTGEDLPLPQAGAVSAPVDLGLLSVAVRDGYRGHVHEVLPGLWLVAAVPAPPSVGAAGAGIWAGLAGGITDVVTGLGDWIAGWFPKAQRARAEGQAASESAAMDLQAQYADLQLDIAERQAALERQKVRTALRAQGLDKPIDLADGLDLRLVSPDLTADEIANRVTRLQSQLGKAVQAGVSIVDAAVGGPGRNRGGGHHGRYKRPDRDDEMLVKLVRVGGLPVGGDCACGCGGTCGCGS